MKQKTKIILYIIIAIIIFTSKVFAGMADMDDETSQIIANEMIANQEKEEAENEGKSNNNYLSKLEVKGYGLSPKFDKQTQNYKAEIAAEDIDLDTITIEAEADDSRAKVSGIGKIELNNGENNIRIDVTAENGTVRTYFINVNKEKSEEEKETSANNEENTINNNENTENKDYEIIENILKIDQKMESKKNKNTIAAIAIVVAIIAIILMIIPKSKNKNKRKRR